MILNTFCGMFLLRCAVHGQLSLFFEGRIRIQFLFSRVRSRSGHYQLGSATGLLHGSVGSVCLSLGAIFLVKWYAHLKCTWFWLPHSLLLANARLSQYTYIIREKRCAKYLTLTLLISSSNCSIYYTTVYSKRTQPSKWLMKSKKWVFIIKIRPKWIGSNLCKEKSWCQLSSR